MASNLWKALAGKKFYFVFYNLFVDLSSKTLMCYDDGCVPLSIVK